MTIASLLGVGADRGTRRAADDRADRGAFRTSGRRSANHRAGTGADDRTTDSILCTRADRHGCKRSQDRRRKNCLAHR